MNLARLIVVTAILIQSFACQSARSMRPTSAPTTAPSEFVVIQKGELPIILTAPHGGTWRIPGVDERTGSNVAKKRGAKTNFTFALDRNADLMTLKVAGEIEKLTGKRPYIVVARFTRRHIDANRPFEEGCESDVAAPYYWRYHNAIKDFRAEIIAKYRTGILVDIHGHGGDPTTLIRGTADWQTVRHLVDWYGKESVVGPEGLLGPIEAAGNKLIPPNADTDAKENPALNGGYTVREYGSFAGGNFDAIQFELGTAWRSPEAIDRLAPQIAAALVKFQGRYLSGVDTAESPATTQK